MLTAIEALEGEIRQRPPYSKLNVKVQAILRPWGLNFVSSSAAKTCSTWIIPAGYWDVTIMFLYVHNLLTSWQIHMHSELCSVWSNCVHCKHICSKYRFVPWPPLPPVTVRPLQINSLFFIPLHRKLHAGRWAWKWILISRMSLFSKYKNISFVIYTLGWDTVQKKSNMHLHPLSTLPSSQPQKKKACTHGLPFGGSQVDKVVVLRLGCTR